MDEKEPPILSYESRGGPLRAGPLIVASVVVPIVVLLGPPLLYGLVWVNVLPFSVIVSPQFRWAVRILVLLPLLCAVLDIVLIVHLRCLNNRSREALWLKVATLWNISLGVGAVLALHDESAVNFDAVPGRVH